MKFRIVATMVGTGGKDYIETIGEFTSQQEADKICEKLSNWNYYYHAYPLEDNATVDGRKT